MQKSIFILFVFFGLNFSFGQNEIEINFSEKYVDEEWDEFINSTAINESDFIVKEINGSIWVIDSILSYRVNESGWFLINSEKVIERDDKGRDITTIRELFDLETSEIYSKELINSTYHDSGIFKTRMTRLWNSAIENWADTTSYVVLDTFGRTLLDFHRKWDSQNNEYVSGEKYISTYSANGVIQKRSVFIWSKEKKSWINRRQTIYTYHNNVEDVLYQIWDIDLDRWENYIFSKAYFNTDGKIIEGVRQRWDRENQIWNNNSRGLYLYEYNPFIFTAISQRWNKDQSNWGNLRKVIDKYNNQGWKSEKIEQNWDAISSQFVNYKQEIFDYNYKGKKIFELMKLWDNVNSSWYNVNQRINSFDSIQNIETLLFQTFDIEKSVWVNQRVVYTYFELGEIVKVLNKNWNEDLSQWDNYLLHTYIFDLKGNRINNLRQKWDKSNSSWINIWQVNYEYDSQGNRAHIVSQDWNNQLSSWIDRTKVDFYWSEYELTSIDKIMTDLVKVYPNPAYDKINVVFEKSKQDDFVEIISISGKVLLQKNINKTNQIDISNLANGLYFIKNSYGEIVGKFIKN